MSMDAVMQAEVVTSDLSRDEALVLTERIKETMARAEATQDQAGDLLLDAHTHGAWVALSYETWKSYVEDEFGWSESHSFQMLKKARLERATRAAVGMASVGELDSGAPQSDPTEVEPIFTMRSVRVFKDEEPEDVAAEIAEEVAAGASASEAVKTTVARRKENRYAPVSEHHVPVPPVKDVRAELRRVMHDVRAVVESVPDAGRGDAGVAEELRQWVTVLSILTGRTPAGDALHQTIYRLRAEAYEHLLTLGETRDGLAHLSDLKVATINYWLGQRRAGTIRVPNAEDK